MFSPAAGVFLLIRCSFIFEHIPYILLKLCYFGATTTFFASIIGILQNDIKKIIAYSTCSQLGYMVFICGLSNYSVSLYHLSNHAFFKALLFLCAGTIIHSLADEQDLRRFGGLSLILPYTYSCMLIGSLALMGFPFLSGFYSKDAILEIAATRYNVANHFVFWLGTISAFCTSFYSIRLLFLVFLTKTNLFFISLQRSHDAPILIAFVLGCLVTGSIFFGYFLKDYFIGIGTVFFKDSIFFLPKNFSLIDSEFCPYFIKLLPTFFSLSGGFLAAAFYFKFY
jgi:NADH-ubiquinone oxidoreductase chain 5